jgi:hypothetical protein
MLSPVPAVRRAARAWPAVLLLSACSSPAPAPPVTRVACPETPLDQTRRLYDFTPIGPGNPVVATVDDCWIQIPLGEFRGHLAAEVPTDQRASLTKEEKRKQLDRLVDEHLLLMDAYRQKANESGRAVNMLDNTRKMLLGELLTAREVDQKAKRPEEQTVLRKQLLDRAFQRAQISVDNQGYADLREALKQLVTRAGSADPGKLIESLPGAVREKPLARLDSTTFTVADGVAAWLRLPENARPKMERREGLDDLLKGMLEQDLLAAEAIREGIDRTRPYLEKVELNRNAIVRMWSQDHSAERTRRRMAEPDIPQRLREWYTEHLKTRYTYKGEDGKEKVMPFEGNEETIRNDYNDTLRDKMRAEEGRALRQGHKIVVDEAALDQA